MKKNNHELNVAILLLSIGLIVVSFHPAMIALGSAQDHNTRTETTIETVTQVASEDDPYSTIKVTEWTDEFHDYPPTYAESRHYSGLFANTFVASFLPPAGASLVPPPLISVYVDDTLYQNLIAEISTYVADLNADSYQVNLYVGTYGDHVALKADLQQAYQQSPATFKGALFIGDIAAPWYHDEYNYNKPVPAEFPLDLFYMDLDGTWTDNNGDGIYEQHSPGTGDVGPEIWIGRIDATTLSGDTIELYQNYFAKNHAYRSGDLYLPNRALVYVDNDWAKTNWKDDHTMLYPYTQYVDDLDGTNGNDYRNRLTWDYDWITVFVHSSPNGHGFYSPYSGNQVSSSQIEAIDPHAMFYNLFACSAALFTANNYLAGNYLFADTYGVAVIGSTKSGSMLYFEQFNQPLSEGKTLGESFKDWFNYIAINGFSSQELSWHYGMGIFGDPTLHPNIPNDLPVSYVDVEDYSTVRGIKDFIGSARRGLAPGSNFDQFTLSFGVGINPDTWVSTGITLQGNGALEVEDDVLGWFDTSVTLEGFNTLRLSVEDDTGQVTDYRVVITVNNIDSTDPAEDGYYRSGDVISIQGTVAGTALDHYIIEYQNDPLNWWTTGISLTNGGTEQIIDGELATWDTSSLVQSDYYTMRITRYDTTGFVAEDYFTFVLDPELRPGWPLKVNEYAQTPVIANVDADPELEIFLTAHDRDITNQDEINFVYGFDHDGTPLSGWPQKMRLSYGFPSIGDLDADGDLEIVVGSSQKMKVWDADGTLLWYKTFIKYLSGPITLADLNTDGTLEVIATTGGYYGGGTNSGIFVYDANGAPLWQHYFGDDYGVYGGSAAVGDLTGDGTVEIIVATYAGEPSSNDGKLFVYSAMGTLLWTMSLSRTSSAPVLGDVDNDGMLEIFVNGIDGANTLNYTHGFRSDGSLLPGWPQLLAGPSTATPVLSDLDEDGYLDVIVGYAGGIGAWDFTGAALPGWPISNTMIGEDGGKLCVGDLDGIPGLEIIVTLGDNIYDRGLLEYHHDGTQVQGWMKIIRGAESSYPVLADLDFDNKLDIIISGSDGRVYVFSRNDLSGPWTPTWPQYQHNACHTGLYHAPTVQHVLVDDDFNVTTPGWQVTRFAVVQQGINAVSPGQAVYVKSGTYSENIKISKSLSLIGDGVSTTRLLSKSKKDHVVHITASNVVCSGFRIQGASQAYAGVFLEYVNSCTLTDNYLTSNGRGVVMKSCSEMHFSGNVLKANLAEGLSVMMSHHVFISDNILTLNHVGLLIDCLSHNALVVRNIVGMNSKDGILVRSSHTNMVAGNTIEQNQRGLQLSVDSTGNVVYHNNFLNNALYQAYDATDEANTWHNGYPSGGNYWDDYAGTDLYSGPLQNLPGSDGIGDKPYHLPEGTNTDPYPLMEPWMTADLDIVFVDDDFDASTVGWGYDHFDSLQEGIDAVYQGGTVQVYSGQYTEDVLVYKHVDLSGAGADTTTLLSASNSNHVVRIQADHVRLHGFTVTGAPSGCAGVYVSEASSVCIYDNTMLQNGLDDKGGAGPNKGPGIELMDVLGGKVMDNTLTGNWFGIRLTGCTGVRVVGNTIVDNSNYGMTIMSSQNNQIYNNYFNNTLNAFDSGMNQWNTSKTSGVNIVGGPFLGGNFWSDYTGVDLNGDGLGDTPYIIAGGSNLDFLPLMESWGSTSTAGTV
ncbi:MAG: right-handed parallel beta-helix repeat-containing protein [Candidatus Thermoplasmatota archaeon]|nr:right-handed parallel beta-helix repeat-containing protein [Candidatus Thermoplasmatota archaeon]